MVGLQHVPERTPTLWAAQRRRRLHHQGQHRGGQLALCGNEHGESPPAARHRRRAFLRGHPPRTARLLRPSLARLRREAVCLLGRLRRLLRPHLRPQQHHAIHATRLARFLRSRKGMVGSHGRPRLPADEIPEVAHAHLPLHRACGRPKRGGRTERRTLRPRHRHPRQRLPPGLQLQRKTHAHRPHQSEWCKEGRVVDEPLRRFPAILGTI